MPIYDIYGNESLAKGQHPKPISHSSTSSYFMKMPKGEFVILDTQRASTVSFQIEGNPADLQVEISNQDYRALDTNTYPVEYARNMTGGNPPEAFIAPETPIIWTTLMPPSSTFMKLDTTAISQIQLTPASGMVLHVEMDETPATSVTWIPDAGGLPPIAGGVTLADVIEAINNQIDFEPNLIQDNGTNDYYYSEWQSTADGTTQTLVYYDMAGNAVAAPADPIPVQQEDYEAITSCYEAMTAGTGYSVGDKITRISFVDPKTQVIVGEIWRNDITGGVITPVVGDLKPCAPEQSYLVQEKLYDYDSTGKMTEFLRTYLKDANGVNILSINTALDGTTLYTPTGLIRHTPQRRSMGFERIKFSDSGINMFGSIPDGAEYAEYHVWGGDCVITTNGFPPADAIGEGIRLQDGTSPELESIEEIKGFQVIGQADNSGIIYVEYFSHR